MLVIVEVSPVPPAKVRVSVPSVTVSVPLSPAIAKSVLIFAVVAAVILPCWSIVSTGIAVALP